MSWYSIRERVSSVVLGKRLETSEIKHQTAPNFIALAVLASDALSSVAYATEEILLVLNGAAIAGSVFLGFQGNAMSIPIAIAICTLITIVTISYRQTIFSNPAGGGGYRVAKENLGEELAQVTGSSLLLDYILTVSVSISAGVAQLISVFRDLAPFRVHLTVAIILLMTIINMRGVKESARLLSIPTYFFLATAFLMLGVGMFRAVTGTLPTVTGVEPIHHAANELIPFSFFLVLRAFSSGCTALTGIEAISNDTQLFEQPRAKNAANTLAAMSTILIVLFLSITVLANQIQAIPSHSETIISQLARTIYGTEGGGNVMYVISMAGAFAVLFMAANTPFADFPQLAALSSADGFLPRQMTYRGRRLVFSWGIVVLAAGSIFFVLITGALTTNLIPLYAIGVFLGFTISQSGMVRRFWRAGHLKAGEVAYGLETKIYYDPSWRTKIAISGIGALITFVVMMVLIITKFTSGGWAIVVLIPLMVWVFFQIHRHYKETAARLKLEETPTFDIKPIVFDPDNMPAQRDDELAIYFCDTWSELSLSVVKAILKRKIPMKIIHIDVDGRRADAFRKRSAEIVVANGWNEGIIEVIEDQYRDLYAKVSETLKELRAQYPDLNFQVYVGALRTRWPYSWLHMATDRFLRDALMDIDNVSFNVRQVNIDQLPLPPGFKVTFEHATDQHFAEEHELELAEEAKRKQEEQAKPTSA
jgi:amino acid transporter